jgi:AAA family ATP:ADP antiporter
VISAGGSTGAVVGPIITGTLVIPVGFQYLLPVSALLLLAGVYCIYRLRHWVRQHDDAKGSETIESEKTIGGSAFEGMLLVFRKPYFGMIAIALLLANFVGVFTYTYLLELVQITFEGMDRHIQVLAWIDAAINVFSFIGQLVLVKISVRRIGIGYTLALLPIVSAIGFALLALNPVFIIMAVLQILRRSLTFGFSKPTNDMLYSVVSTKEKYKVKNFIETAIYRSGDVIGAWSIRLLSGIGITGTAIICIPIAIAWAAISLRIGREYRRLDESTSHDQTPLKET